MRLAFCPADSALGTLESSCRSWFFCYIILNSLIVKIINPSIWGYFTRISDYTWRVVQKKKKSVRIVLLKKFGSECKTGYTFFVNLLSLFQVREVVALV